MGDEKKQGQAVAIREQAGVPRLYSDLAELKEAFEYAREHAILLSPVMAMDAIPAMHSVSLRIVHINPDIKGGDIYVQGDDEGGDSKAPLTEDSEVSLTKVALDRITGAAGINWDLILSGRLDDRSEPDYCLFRAVGTMKDFDGTVRQIGAERDIDLRNGSPTIKGWSEKRLKKAREYLHPMTESKARNRAIRQALAIRGKYRISDLRKPFVVPRLVFDVNRIEDPETRRQVTLEIAREARGATTMLYGPGHGQPPPPALTAPPPPQPVVTAPPQDAEMGKRQPPPVGAGGEPPDDDDPPQTQTEPAKESAPAGEKKSGKFGF